MMTALAIAGLAVSPAFAGTIDITLDESNTGNYWWTRYQYSGGNDTQSGFVYGDGDGLVFSQRNYQYYGGADRWFEERAIYIQISLSALGGVSPEDILSATFNFYVAENSSDTDVTWLRHLTTQGTAPTGDASQQLAGDANVISSAGLTLGWNSIYVTDFILSDLDKGCDWAVFSILSFNQEQDFNRILSIYGGGAADSFRPYLSVVLIPEPATGLLALAGVALLLRRKRR